MLVVSFRSNSGRKVYLYIYLDGDNLAALIAPLVDNNDLDGSPSAHRSSRRADDRGADVRLDSTVWR